MSKTTLALTARQLKRVFNEGRTKSSQLAGIRQELANDTAHTQEWKAPRVKKAQELGNATFRELGAAAKPLIESFFEQVEQQRNQFDFTDTAFQQALSTVATLGDKMPAGVQRNIEAHFAGNLQALKALKVSFEKHGLGTDSISKAIDPLDSLGVEDNEAVSRFLGYAVSDQIKENQWNPTQLESIVDRYCAALAVDTSRNPYGVMLDEFIASTPNAAMRTRAESWKKAYGDLLEQDDPHTMTMTANRLDAWAQGQAIPPQGAE